MQKKLLLSLLVIPLLFLSCAKEEGHYSNSRLKVNVDLDEALLDLEEVNEGDFTLDSKHRIRVQNFLYTANGVLIDVLTDHCEQYYEYPTFRFENLPLGQYILLTATDILERDGKSYEPVFWEFLGTKSLDSFSVRGTDRMDSMGERMLTLTMSHVNIDGRRKSVSLDVDVEPVTALVCNTFFDVFYWDDHTVEGERRNRIYNYFDISYDHDYNTVTYDPKASTGLWSYSVTGTESDFYTLDRIDPNQLDKMGASSIYGFHALLPGEYKFSGYGEYKFSNFTDEIFTDETRATGGIMLRPGRQYYLDFDIKEWSLTYQIVKTRSASSEEGTSMSDKVTDSSMLMPNPTTPIVRPTR